jgi:hypothetical protein
MLEPSGRIAQSLKTSETSLLVEAAGLLVPLTLSKTVLALQLVKMSHILQRIPHSARMQEMDVKVATLLGTGLQRLVSSLEVIILIRARARHACRTAWLHAHTMFQLQPNTQLARQVSIRPLDALASAVSLDIPRAKQMTSSKHLMPTVSRVWQTFKQSS